MFRLLRTSILILVVVVSSVGIAPPAPRPAVAAATIWYVATTGNDANSCSSPAQSCKTIQAAVDKAVNGDIVKVALGTYTGNSIYAVVDIVHKGLRLLGGWDSTFTAQIGLSMIDGEDVRKGMRVYSLEGVEINHFHISRGRTDGRGAGIQNEANSVLTLTNSAITNNTVGQVATTGGDGGGGIFNFGSLTISNSLIANNNSISNVPGSAITNGGILTLTNSTISNNFGSMALFQMGYLTMTINNSTITNNYGGVVVWLGLVHIRNSIIADNRYDDCITNYQGYGGMVISDGYNIFRGNSNCMLSSNDLSNIDPKLGPLQDNGGLTPTYTLLHDSPLINAGNPNGCWASGEILLIDQRGAPRLGRCDIGAYEANFSVAKQVRGKFEPNGSITYTIKLVNLSNGLLLTNTIVTDILPPQISYTNGTLTASNGVANYNNSVITWTGEISNNTPTIIQFQSKISGVAQNMVITNTATGAWAGYSTSASATFDTFRKFYLPFTARNYCPNFTDDFSQPRGWFTIDSNLRRVELLNGEYRSLSKQSGYLFLYRAPTCPRENYSVEVDARWAQTGSDLGLIFGDNGDYSNFYFFDINTDFQAFILLRYSGGAYTTLVPPTQTSAILPGTQNNKLRVIRNGTAISLYANNILLGTWYDGAIAGLTYVGLATSPYDDVPVSDARFDNFSVASLGISGGASLPSLEPPSVTATSRPLPANINWQPQLNLKVVEQP